MVRTINQRFSLRESERRCGGFSDVFKAVDIESESLDVVAVKLLRLGQHEDAVANMSVAREFESLAKLSHPNIVRLIDAGVDDLTGERYLVLEWVDSSMEKYLEGGLAEPDDFIGGIGIKLSAAMAFAHESGVAHRDLKPANVLLTAEGDVKVADFGISRIVDYVDVRPEGQSPTFAMFGTPPYIPPEREAPPLARDVWGLGATLLSGLVRRSLSDDNDRRAAMKELDVVSELGDIVLSCLSESPAERPADCRVVDARLRQFWNRRQARSLERVSVYINASRAAAGGLDILDLDAAARFVAADLRDAPSILVARNDKGEDRQYQLLGEARLYRVGRDNTRNPLPRLSVIQSFEPSAMDADRVRDQGLTLDYVDFKAGIPADRAAAEDALERLVDDVERHDAEFRSNRRGNEALRVLDQWRHQIDARSKIESDRERPVEYTRVERKDRRAVFTVRGNVDGVEIGEVRRALSTSAIRHFVRGEVEDVSDNTITLYLDEGVEGIPSTGKLVIDTQPSRVKIHRERSAVDVIAHTPGKAARADLPSLLFDPGSARLPEPVEVDEWVSASLDDSKRAAVRAALGSPDLFLVQGPPGTGKTTFIAELVAQELRRNPRATILIASQTNVALDNALDRIDRIHTGDRPPTIIRLADPKHGKVGADAERFRVDGQLRKWRKLAELRSKAFVDAWVEGRGLSVASVEESRFLHELATLLDERSHAEAELSELDKFYDEPAAEAAESLTEEEKEEFDDRLQAAYDRISDTDVRLERFQQSNKGLINKYQADVDAVDGGAVRQKADKLLGGSAVAMELRSLIQLQADWLLRLGRGDGFIAALAQDSSVIGATCIGLAAVQELGESQFDLCVVDECSKATATETLVPMVRAKRWVLVGDEKQLPPMVEHALRSPAILDEFELDRVELETTLFSRLAQTLPGPCQIMLTAQHRMVKPIGDLISECFYGGELTSVGATSAPEIPQVLPRPVTWHDTSRREDRYENKLDEHQFSYVNQTEARVAADLVRRLNTHFRGVAERKSVLVIAPYAAQVQELRRRIRQLGNLESLEVEVATVDAVQGREADFVVFTVTRSNPRGDAGFLRLDARANVALSRARSGLAIIGDLAFSRTADSPFKDVAHHVSSHPESCARVEVPR